MSYIIHVGKIDITLSDEEYTAFKKATDAGTWFERKSNGERINPTFVTSAERVQEPPKNDPKAVNNRMEKQREKEKDNPPMKPYGSRTNAS